jgi:hypothetical protein
MTVLTAHCAHYTLPPELVSTVFERYGCRLYVAALLGRIVGGWAANRQVFWLFFPGLVRRSRLDEYTDDGVENGVA